MDTEPAHQIEICQPHIVSVHSLVEGADPPVEVRGQIDGLYARQEPVIIEEIKTTTLSLELVNEDHNPLHWAQAQVYTFMVARQYKLSEVSIHLTYYHLDNAERSSEGQRAGEIRLQVQSGSFNPHSQLRMSAC